jgi:hypothetical protein
VLGVQPIAFIYLFVCFALKMRERGRGDDARCEIEERYVR